MPSTTGQVILRRQVNWRKRRIGGRGDEDIAGEQHSGEIDSKDPFLVRLGTSSFLARYEVCFQRSYFCQARYELNPCQARGMLPETIFLVRLGTSSILARHEVALVQVNPQRGIGENYLEPHYDQGMTYYLTWLNISALCSVTHSNYKIY